VSTSWGSLRSLKATIPAGSCARSFAGLLPECAEADAVLDKMKVSRALRNVRGVDMARATQLTSRCEIAETRKLAGLGTRQRQALIDALH
jgi:hypothetical protein